MASSGTVQRRALFCIALQCGDRSGANVALANYSNSGLPSRSKGFRPDVRCFLSVIIMLCGYRSVRLTIKERSAVHTYTSLVSFALN